MSGFGKSNSFTLEGAVTAGPMLMGSSPTIADAAPAALAPSQPQPGPSFGNRGLG